MVRIFSETYFLILCSFFLLTNLKGIFTTTSLYLNDVELTEMKLCGFFLSDQNWYNTLFNGLSWSPKMKPNRVKVPYIYKYGFQWSCTPFKRFWKKVMWTGRYGFIFSGILASSGVRFPFLTLQWLQAVTKFSQLSDPPRLRGRTWSRVKSDLTPQYWHVWLSLFITFLLESTIFA